MIKRTHTKNNDYRPHSNSTLVDIHSLQIVDYNTLFENCSMNQQFLEQFIRIRAF